MGFTEYNNIQGNKSCLRLVHLTGFFFFKISGTSATDISECFTIYFLLGRFKTTAYYFKFNSSLDREYKHVNV